MSMPPEPEIVAYWTCENNTCAEFGIFKWATWDFPEVKCGICQEMMEHHELMEPMPHEQFQEFAQQEQQRE